MLKILGTPTEKIENKVGNNIQTSMSQKLWRLKVDGRWSESCPVAGFGITGMAFGSC